MFDHYAVIPLDVPRLPVNSGRFRDFVQTHCECCAFTRNTIRWVMFYARKPVIDGQVLLHACDPRMDSPCADAAFEWDPTFGEAFPELVAWFERLPFKSVHGVNLVTQTDDISDHLDVFGKNNSETYYRRFHEIEPVYYRAMVCDPGDDIARNGSFYVTRQFGGEKHFVSLPPGTDTFAMSSSTCYHGAVFNPGHFKTTIVVYGDMDRHRHLELLARSLEKNGDYAIRFDESGPVSGPGAEMPYRGASY